MVRPLRLSRPVLGVLGSLLLVPLSAAGGCGGDDAGSGGPGGATTAGAGGTGSGTGTGTGNGGTGTGTNTPPASLCLTVEPVKMVPPAGLNVQFRVLDCDGNAVRPLTPGDVKVFNDVKGQAFGAGNEGDSVSDVGANSTIELYSVLVLDMSNSIAVAGAQGAVIDGAKAFVTETVTKPKAELKHRVAIIAFGAPDAITLEQDFTQDDGALNAKLEELRASKPRGTTDLYGAYVKALKTVAAAGSGGDAVVEKFVVMLTDGTHEAGNDDVLRSQALELKHQTEATFYALGIQGNYDACKLEELAGRGGPGAKSSCREGAACDPKTAAPAKCTQFFSGVDQAAISQAFQEVAARVEGLARSNYAVGICTPVALGNPTLTLKVAVDGVKAQETLPYAAEGHLNGHVNECNAAAVQSSKLACDASGECVIVCLNKTCGEDHGTTCGTCGAKQVCGAKQTCEDVCAGKDCGTDQGVSCGTCVGKQVCSPKQLCHDVCAGMNCGTEEGVSCGGACPGNQYCEANVCTAPCAGKKCGTDHGAACGECGAKQICNPAQQCENVCVGMTCGTDQGVACGSCGAGNECDPANQCVPCAGGYCQDPSCKGGLDCGGISCCDAQLVPGGTFPMGRSTKVGDPDYANGSSDELPEHSATVADFRLDTFEVTVGRFRKFVDAYDGTPPAVGAGAHPLIANSGWQAAWNASLAASQAALKGNLKCDATYQTWTDAPGANESYGINCVSWYEAAAFCAWDGGRMPTEAEWEYASAGGSDNRLYPWGSQAPNNTRAVFNCQFGGDPGACSFDDLAPVGSTPAGNARWGHRDLAGGMWEWNLDWYADGWYSGGGAVCSNCANLDAASSRGIRGGGWIDNPLALRVALRNSRTPTARGEYVGARCARSAP